MRLSVRKLVYMSLLTAISLVMFIVEQQIPPIVPIPAVKIGLSNTITLFVLFLGENWKGSDCLMILGVRILLSALITGQPVALLFSATGGLLAYFAMLLSKRVIKGEKIIVIVSIIGAFFHNIGQIIVATVLYGSFSILYYLPALTVSAIVGGFLTGMCTAFIFRKQRKLIDNLKHI